MSLSATDVADFLKHNPDFLINNPGILAFVHLPGQSTEKVASLQERQVQTMRDKVKSLEQKLVDVGRAAVENQAILNNLQTLQRNLLRVIDTDNVPGVLVSEVQKHFSVPMAKLALWGEQLPSIPPAFKGELSESQRAQVNAISGVYCGFAEHAPVDFFACEESRPRSVVLIPLRVGLGPIAFGCLSLGSPDKDRFAPNLSTDFLTTLAETACAALTRLTRQTAI
ncbi:MAG: DUF484 family protein [Limnobacter sp.]|nr:DUF484 family protein [Limnobacter sp.]